jgi:hypothetical protein
LKINLEIKNSCRLVVCHGLGGGDDVFHAGHDKLVKLSVVVGGHFRQISEQLSVCVSLVPDQTHEHRQEDNNELELKIKSHREGFAYNSVDWEVFEEAAIEFELGRGSKFRGFFARRRWSFGNRLLGFGDRFFCRSFSNLFDALFFNCWLRITVFFRFF